MRSSASLSGISWSGHSADQWRPIENASYSNYITPSPCEICWYFQNHLLESLTILPVIVLIRTEHGWVWIGLAHTGQLQHGPSLMGASRHVVVLLRMLLRFKGPEPCGHDEPLQANEKRTPWTELLYNQKYG